jgi:hypothetical protein
MRGGQDRSRGIDRQLDPVVLVGVFEADVEKDSQDPRDGHDGIVVTSRAQCQPS